MHFSSFTAPFFTTLAIFFHSSIGAPAPTPSPDPSPITSHWPGWDEIDKLFVFGASYTSTGFDWIKHPLPSPELPLGNTRRGSTSSNGPNFITYLTTTFNASSLQTYNFAFPGAQVDHTATKRGPSNDMRQQVLNGFLPSYTHKLHEPFADWEGSRSLFVSFFGINDILTYYKRPDPEPVTTRIMDAYATHLDTLYAAGARNFLLLNTPPLALAPYFNSGETASGHGDRLTTPHRASDRATVKTVTDDYNSRFPSLVADFQSSHPEATVFWYDTHALFTSLQCRPETLSEYTEEYRLPGRVTNLTQSCKYYTKKGLDYLGSDDYRDERCGGSVGSYFWLNGLHVTWSVHKILAGRIAEGLWKGADGGRLI
ncbi:MAG: hypothetical protein LQ343_007219 [Gyalolechia ehrenbergii]|nr:MAG: hypothetical protein LQ343_007219 [Gyalolechia ehrenbergii]